MKPLPEQDIFALWNLHKGRPWKGAKELSGFRRSLIRQAVKAHGEDAVKGAIENYAKILKSKDYKWSHAWTLDEFLTRKQKCGLPQICRFLPDSFNDWDWMTDSARDRKKRARNEVLSDKMPVKAEMKSVNDCMPKKITAEDMLMASYAEKSDQELMGEFKRSSFDRRYIELYRPDFIERQQRN